LYIHRRSRKKRRRQMIGRRKEKISHCDMKEESPRATPGGEGAKASLARAWGALLRRRGTGEAQKKREKQSPKKISSGGGDLKVVNRRAI